MTGHMRAGLLVVGGGPAAHAAAAAYRDRGGDGPVLLVSDDDTPPYFRPPLSKEFLRGEVGEDDLPLDGLDGTEIRTGTRVTALDATDRLAHLGDGGTVAYGQCVLATGSAPVTLPVPGASGGLYLRTLSDARTLVGQARDAGTAVVVGSGFIGCEAAVSLARRGLGVTVCSTEPLPQAARLGDAVGERLRDWLAEDGVAFRGAAEVTGIENGQVVHVRDGEPSRADMVLVAAGAAPRGTLAAEAGIPVEGDRVVVDEHMRSQTPGILAAGDVAMARNAAAGRHLAVEHWGDAETMGGIAGAVAAGADDAWDVPPGFWTVIGERVLKYAAWGDGFDEVAVSTHTGGGFTAWFVRGDQLAGVATHLADEDYEQGSELVRQGAPASAAPGTPGMVGPHETPNRPSEQEGRR